MSNQSDARRARRQCTRQGHVPKNGAPGERYCARCGDDLPDDGGAGVREPRDPAPSEPPLVMAR